MMISPEEPSPRNDPPLTGSYASEILKDSMAKPKIAQVLYSPEIWKSLVLTGSNWFVPGF